ncbi:MULTISPECIES: hypothetical protein [unclassified Streptomyces]|uniref:hypothetical protein n=1 Tax=unclassified Streptomyces TaxID=2593676 RepID=UPI0004754C6D|nr:MULTISPECIES: hypothetical protein [unclassified Streptomyces]MYX38994.1 hypothetical protein [Streptomyces sp. SID8377]
MLIAEACVEIDRIIEAGGVEDALNLSRRLAREGQVNPAVAVRRTVSRGELDRGALWKTGEDFAEIAARNGQWVRVEHLDPGHEAAQFGEFASIREGCPESQRLF